MSLVSEQRMREFRLFFNHTIHPELVRMDQRRRRLLRLIFVSAVLMAALLGAALYLDIFAFTLFLLAPLGFYISYLLWQVRIFRLSFKPRIVNLLLDFIDDAHNYGTLSYEPKKSIPLELFKRSRIFPDIKLAVYQGEDFIEGRIGDIHFQASELWAEYYSRVRNRLERLFRGFFLYAELQEPLRGSFLVLPRHRLPFFTRSVKQVTLAGGKCMDAFVTNAQFRKHFTTYASKAAPIRSVLSEAMQHEIVDYYLRTRKDMYFSFRGKHVYVAVSEDKDLLEPYVFRSNVSFELIREFYEDLKLLLEIIEDIDASH